MLVPLCAMAADPALLEVGPLALHPEWAPSGLPARDPPAPVAWADIPVVRGVHPVRFHYGRRYQEILADTMGGPRASSLFGPTVAEADVHWRLVDATGYGLPYDAEMAADWRDNSLAASVLAATTLLDETLERAPALHALWVIGDTVVNPSFDARRTDEGVEVSHRLGGRERRAIERREEEEGEVRTPRKRTPSFGAGLDWELRDEDAPKGAALIQYKAWVAGSELGLSAFRLEVSPLTLAWLATAREQVYPRVYVIGSASSADRDYTPGRLSGGLMWVVPGDRWNVRAERIVSVTDQTQVWMLTVRREDHTEIPAPLEPPLGDRGREGPTLPWAPPGENAEAEGW